MIKSLTSKVERLETQYDLLLQQYFALASSAVKPHSTATPDIFKTPVTTPSVDKSDMLVKTPVTTPSVDKPVPPATNFPSVTTCSPSMTPQSAGVLLDPDVC